MENKITKFPISFKQKQYNKYGTGYIPCEISDRWLQFSDTFDENLGLVFVDVMTNTENGSPRKLCSLCLNINDLKNELSKIKPE
ncbi:hypothetical protein [Lacrimispora sp. 38-1]|uniref:hypothetical protein n=1 Tax=Lacrimispora sp. 38-1 TaxID=3125778 RepID=UPI003CE80CD9